MTNNSAALRVGLIGYGTAGRFFHAPLLATTPGLSLAAIVTSDAERGASARETPNALPNQQHTIDSTVEHPRLG